MVKIKTLLFVDPQSYSNLAMYDYSLIEGLKVERVIFLGNELYDYEKFGVNVVFVPLFRYSKKSNPLSKTLSYLFSLLSLFHYIFRYKPDLIHVQWTKAIFFDLIIYSLIKAVFGLQIVLTAHNVLPHNYKGKKPLFLRLYYQMVTAIIVHTESSKSDMVRIFGNRMQDKIDVIPHGILKFAVDDEEVNKQINIFQSKYGLCGRIVFSSLGFQSLYKGTDIIVNAWSTLPVEMKNSSKLLIFGKNEGVDFSIIADDKSVVIENRFVSNVEFLALLRLSNVVLLPYREISQSGLLLSAIGEHIPIIASNIGGLSEPFKIAKIGWSMDEPSAESLRKVIINLLQNREELENIRTDSDGWNRVVDTYKWSSISNKTYLLYCRYATSS